MTEIKTQKFNDVEIHVLPYQNTSCFIAHEVGAALGYKEPKDFTRKITSDWANEFIEGLERFKAEGEDLAQLRIVVGESPTTIISPMTRSLLLLTREGVWLACAKANTDKGVAFRRWLARELLPALQDGTHQLTHGTTLQQVPLPALKDPEASRLLLAWTKPLERNGTLRHPEHLLLTVEGAEMALGREIPILRRAVDRRLREVASNPLAASFEANQPQLPLFSDEAESEAPEVLAAG